MKTPASLFARSLTVLLITLFARFAGLGHLWRRRRRRRRRHVGRQWCGGSAPETYPVPWKVRNAKDSAGEGTSCLLVPGLE